MNSVERLEATITCVWTLNRTLAVLDVGEDDPNDGGFIASELSHSGGDLGKFKRVPESMVKEIAELRTGEVFKLRIIVTPHRNLTGGLDDWELQSIGTIIIQHIMRGMRQCLKLH